MKFAKLTGAWAALVICISCARSPEAGAGAPAGPSAPNAAPTEVERVEAPAAAVPAPQGLDQRPERSKAPSDQGFRSLDAAEEALNRAKGELDRLALAEQPTVVPRGSAADRAAEKKAEGSAQSPSPAAAAKPAPSGACENGCRAFASLARAAHAVCRLDGGNGSHCARAKRVLAQAEQRVAVCSCPASED